MNDHNLMFNNDQHVDTHTHIHRRALTLQYFNDSIDCDTDTVDTMSTAYLWPTLAVGLPAY